MASLAKRLHIFVNSFWFQTAILGVIVVASVLIGVETHFAFVERHAVMFEVLNAVILAIFVIEIILRVGSYGRHPLKFFLDPWNVFDFIVVMITTLPLHVQFFTVFRLMRIVRVLEIVRVVRVVKAVRILRLVPHLRELQFVVDSLVRSIPPITSVALLLGLHFYIYAVIGTFLFHTNDPVHFGSLATTMLSLFETLTLEGWVTLMTDQFATEGIPSFVVAGYFVTFIGLGTMIIMNLVIGAVVSSMGDTKEEQDEIDHIRKRGGRLTVREELRLLEEQLKEATVVLRLLQKTLESQEGAKEKLGIAAQSRRSPARRQSRNEISA